MSINFYLLSTTLFFCLLFFSVCLSVSLSVSRYWPKVYLHNEVYSCFMVLSCKQLQGKIVKRKMKNKEEIFYLIFSCTFTE